MFGNFLYKYFFCRINFLMLIFFNLWIKIKLKNININFWSLNLEQLKFHKIFSESILAIKIL